MVKMQGSKLFWNAFFVFVWLLMLFWLRKGIYGQSCQYFYGKAWEIKMLLLHTLTFSF
jgi:hypothetical protein